VELDLKKSVVNEVVYDKNLSIGYANHPQEDGKFKRTHSVKGTQARQGHIAKVWDDMYGDSGGDNESLKTKKKETKTHRPLPPKSVPDWLLLWNWHFDF